MAGGQGRASGRPGEVDRLSVAGLDCTTFARFARLSGQVPVVGIAGRKLAPRCGFVDAW